MKKVIVGSDERTEIAHATLSAVKLTCGKVEEYINTLVPVIDGLLYYVNLRVNLTGEDAVRVTAAIDDTTSNIQTKIIDKLNAYKAELTK